MEPRKLRERSGHGDKVLVVDDCPCISLGPSQPHSSSRRRYRLAQLAYPPNQLLGHQSLEQEKQSILGQLRACDTAKQACETAKQLVVTELETLRKHATTEANRSQSEFAAQLAQKLQQIRDLEQQSTALATKNQQLQHEIQRLSLTPLQPLVQNVQDSVCEKRVESLRKQYEEVRKQYEEQVQRLKLDNDVLSKTNSSLSSCATDLPKCEAAGASSRQELETARRQSLQAQETYRALEVKCAKVAAKLADQVRKNTELAEEVKRKAAVEAQRDDLVRQNRAQKTAINGCMEREAKLTADLQQVQSDLSNLASDLHSARTLASTCEIKQNALQNSLDAQKEAYQLQMKKVERQVRSATKQQIDDLAQKLQVSEASAAQCTKQLVESDKDRALLIEAVTKLKAEKQSADQLRSREMREIEAKAGQVLAKWQAMSTTFTQVEEILNSIAETGKTPELNQLATNFSNGTQNIAAALDQLKQSLNSQPLQALQELLTPPFVRSSTLSGGMFLTNN